MLQVNPTSARCLSDLFTASPPAPVLLTPDQTLFGPGSTKASRKRNSPLRTPESPRKHKLYRGGRKEDLTRTLFEEKKQTVSPTTAAVRERPKRSPECIDFVDFDRTISLMSLIDWQDDYAGAPHEQMMTQIYGDARRRACLFAWFAARSLRGHAVVIVSFGITRDIRVSLEHANLLQFVSRIYGTSPKKDFTVDVWENPELRLEARMIPRKLKVFMRRNSAYNKEEVMAALMLETKAKSSYFYDDSPTNVEMARDVKGLFCNPCGDIENGLTHDQLQFITLCAMTK